MTARSTEVNKNGKTVTVPAADVDGATVITSGMFPRIAMIRDESFVEAGVPQDPARFIRGVGQSVLAADIVTFAQQIYEATPNYSYYFEWDNVAAAETSNFATWWNELPQATRKNCRRAARRDVSTRIASFDDQLVHGIKGIYDETPVRQGRRFWHYGKDLETVRRENGTYLDRSEFLASYLGDELIGFMKIVYVGRVARIMQILSKISHDDKRPTNALIAKAVEVCCEKGVTHLIYSKFQYGNKTNTDVMEFKRRNGFKRVDFPRYYVALTLQGRLALACRLHRGALGILPPRLIQQALRLRASFNRLLMTHDTAETVVHRGGVSGVDN